MDIEKLTHTCQTCDRNDFCDEDSATRHMDALQHWAPFHCDTCARYFKSQQARTIHMDTFKHWTQTDKCDVGLGQSRYTGDHDPDTPHFDLDGHRASIWCKTCGKTFGTEQDHITHKNLQLHWPASFPCQICAAEFPKKRDSIEHMNVDGHWANQGYNFKCPICPKSFPTITGLRSHQKNAWHCYCETCSRGFTSTAGLADHLNNSKVHATQSINCMFCHNEFPTTWAIIDHIENTRCPGAPLADGSTVYQILKKRDPLSIITTSKIAVFPGTGAKAYKPIKGRCWVCPDCRVECPTVESIKNHEESPCAGVMPYHCPNPDCRRPCANLGALFGHLDSYKCNYMSHVDLQKQMDILFKTSDIITFTSPSLAVDHAMPPQLLDQASK